MLQMIRIDGRLIHGQITAGFSRRVNANTIIVANDAAANNPMQKNLMKMAKPPGVNIEVFSLDETIQKINTEPLASKKILLLVKNPIDMLYLIDNGITDETINVGGIINEGANIKMTKEVMATPEELEAWKTLNQKNIRFEMQWDINANITDFNKVIEKF